MTIRTGDYPDILRSSFISPAFKSGDIHVKGNYRPLVKISIIAKIF